MNRPAILSAAAVALAMFGSSAALAQEANAFDGQMTHAMSTKTRAQVNAELQQARADGTIRASSIAYIEPLRVSVARDQIKAELAAARANGSLASINAVAAYLPGTQRAVPVTTTVYASK